MKGQKISEKTYELVKQMLIQGYSVKKVHQMLPEPIRICENSIYKIDKADTYDDFIGVKKEPEKPEKVIQVTPHAQTQEIVDAINRTNVLLESLFQIVKELNDSLK